MDYNILKHRFSEVMVSWTLHTDRTWARQARCYYIREGRTQSARASIELHSNSNQTLVVWDLEIQTISSFSSFCIFWFQPGRMQKFYKVFVLCISGPSNQPNFRETMDKVPNQSALPSMGHPLLNHIEDLVLTMPQLGQAVLGTFPYRT